MTTADAYNNQYYNKAEFKKFEPYHGSPITGLIYKNYDRDEYIVLYEKYKNSINKRTRKVIELRLREATLLNYVLLPELPIRRVFETYMKGKRVLIPFLRSEDLNRAVEYCKSFVVDNSAFSIWMEEQKGNSLKIEWKEYYAWVERFFDEPKFDWFIIPDVIMGTEKENDELINIFNSVYPHLKEKAVPVWHTNESLGRLQRLANEFPVICFGSADKELYGDIGDPLWSNIITKAIESISIDGVPKVKIHMLRCLQKEVFQRFPFDSGDSTRFAQNHNDHTKKGLYPYRDLDCEGCFTKKHVQPLRCVRKPIQKTLFGGIA